MISEIKMPASGLNAAESVIVSWHVKEGDEVNRGDVLFDIETDKATMSVESFAKGTVLKIFYNEGDTVQSGEVVAQIGRKDEQTVSDNKPEIEDKPESSLPEEKKEPVSYQLPEEPDKAQEAIDINDDEKTVLASPAARKMAKDKGIDISAVFIAKSNVVKLDDVLAWNASQAAKEVDTTKMKLQKDRDIISRQSEFSASIKPDMTEILALEGNINAALKEDDIKVSVRDLVVRGVCSAVKRVPEINCIESKTEIERNRSVNVGIALFLQDELIVPVIKDAQKMTTIEIAGNSSQLSDLTKAGTMEPEDMQGSTFVIFDVGVFGISSFKAIADQTADVVLALGSVEETPTSRDGKIVLRPIMDITASFCSGTVNESTAILFLEALKTYLEQPLLMFA